MDLTNLANPLLDGIPIPVERATRNGKGPATAGFRIVSADNHWDVASDIFVERLPPALQARAPRVWIDRYSQVGFAKDGDQVESLFRAEMMDRVLYASTGRPGSWDLKSRAADLDAEGIDAELNFPGAMLFLFGSPDLELREAVFRIYNQYMMERAAESGGRSHGVGVVPNWWDPSKAESTVQEMVDLGLKTFMLPVKPGKDLDGKPVVYSEPGCDRLMKAIEESGIPLCFHVGENGIPSGRGGWGITATPAFQPFLETLCQFMFGGVFDRCPKLQVVFAEGGIAWVAPALQDAETVLDNGRTLIEPLPKLRPSEYWRRNCYATFMNDRLGLSLLDIIGADRVMWGQDYPHMESTLGYTGQSTETVVRMAGPAAARDILSGTAARLFKI